MSELKPPIRKINPVASLPPPSASPLLSHRAAFEIDADAEPRSAPGPTPAPACPAPGRTPLFSPGLPSNMAKTSEDTPVTRNCGITIATLWIPYGVQPISDFLCQGVSVRRKNTHKHDPRLITDVFLPFSRPTRGKHRFAVPSVS